MHRAGHPGSAEADLDKAISLTKGEIAGNAYYVSARVKKAKGADASAILAFSSASSLYAGVNEEARKTCEQEISALKAKAQTKTAPSNLSAPTANQTTRVIFWSEWKTEKQYDYQLFDTYRHKSGTEDLGNGTYKHYIRSQTDPRLVTSVFISNLYCNRCMVIPPAAHIGPSEFSSEASFEHVDSKSASDWSWHTDFLGGNV